MAWSIAITAVSVESLHPSMPRQGRLRRRTHFCRAPPVGDSLSNILLLAAGGAGAEADGGRGRAHLPHHWHRGTHISVYLPPTSCVYLSLCLMKSEVEMHQAVQ